MNAPTNLIPFDDEMNLVCEIVESQAILAPPGTKAPLRPAERPPEDVEPQTIICEIVESAAMIPALGTKAPPRPPGRERSLSESDANEVPALPRLDCTPTVA